jgi:hypothetical protein
MRFEDLTVFQYQELYKIQKSTLDYEDKATQCVSVLTGKTEREIESMPLKDFNTAVSSISTIFEQANLTYEPKRFISINGSRFGICYEPAKLNAGQYLTVQHFMKGDVVENMHYIIASLTYPVKKFWWGERSLPHDSSKHAEIAEGIRDLPFMTVWSACVFFCELLKNSINSLRDYLEKELLKTGMSREKAGQMIAGLQQAMDGFSTPKELQTSTI